MTLFIHELKQSKWSLIIWTVAIAYMLGIAIVIYPQMAPQMNEMGDMFANMGGFTAAFGMDQINFGEFWGYFAIECGNVLGLGGALFAALTGVSALSKEQKDNTAEFLLTHPISRRRIVALKLAAVLTQTAVLTVAVMLAACLATAVIGESIKLKELLLLFVAYLLMQVQIACISFGISAFSRGRGIGAGLGMALMLYFVNILSNLTDRLEALKYLTPFAYADGAYIVSNSVLQFEYIAAGAVFALFGITAAFIRYTTKDIT
ncbi:MAG: ABC transporter permease subunit [Clostridia bacterium]|nr:ABC transporter permease subunit [Clostridia bacterium]